MWDGTKLILSIVPVALPLCVMRGVEHHPCHHRPIQADTDGEARKMRGIWGRKQGSRQGQAELHRGSRAGGTSTSITQAKQGSGSAIKNGQT